MPGAVDRPDVARSGEEISLEGIDCFFLPKMLPAVNGALNLFLPLVEFLGLGGVGELGPPKPCCCMIGEG